MFEGTDLNSAYGMMDTPSYNMPATQPAAPQFPAPPEMTQQGKPVRQMVSVQQPGEVPYQPPPVMFAKEPDLKTVPSSSFWDRISEKRFEVLKVFMLSLIIVLAISMDHVCVHYLTNYISNSLLTYSQELLVRMSYPVAVLLVIWFLKSM